MFDHGYETTNFGKLKNIFKSFIKYHKTSDFQHFKDHFNTYVTLLLFVMKIFVLIIFEKYILSLLLPNIEKIISNFFNPKYIIFKKYSNE